MEERQTDATEEAVAIPPRLTLVQKDHSQDFARAQLWWTILVASAVGVIVIHYLMSR